MRNDQFKITCKQHDTTLTASSENELATKYMDHMKSQHNQSVSMADAMKKVRDENKGMGSMGGGGMSGGGMGGGGGRSQRGGGGK